MRSREKVWSSSAATSKARVNRYVKEYTTIGGHTKPHPGVNQEKMLSTARMRARTTVDNPELGANYQPVGTQP